MLKVYRDISLLISYCALIFVLSHQPTLPVPMTFPHQDKLVHAVAYAVMGVLAWRTFSHLNRPLLLSALISILFCSLYGVSDEYHQSFIVGRNSDINDWFADTIGAAMVIFLLARRGIKK